MNLSINETKRYTPKMLLSILRKKFSLRKDSLDNNYEKMKNGETFQFSLSKLIPSSSEICFSDNEFNPKEDGSQRDFLETQKEILINNYNKMLSTKSELLKEGKEIMKLIHSDIGRGPRKENESDDEFANRRDQYNLLIDRLEDWAEYVRLYVYQYQIIPTHYDEYMGFYKSRLNSTEWFLKKSFRIIETCM